MHISWYRIEKTKLQWCCCRMHSILAVVIQAQPMLCLQCTIQKMIRAPIQQLLRSMHIHNDYEGIHAYCNDELMRWSVNPSHEIFFFFHSHRIHRFKMLMCLYQVENFNHWVHVCQARMLSHKYLALNACTLKWNSFRKFN